MWGADGDDPGQRAIHLVYESNRLQLCESAA